MYDMTDEQEADVSEDRSEETDDTFDYDKLLSRAWENLPESVKEHSRFVIPQIDALAEGNSTVVRNFADIAGILNREMGHIFSYLLKELGTAGMVEGRRGVFKGRISPRNIAQKLENYTNAFVLCSECHKPDTQIVKEGRTQILLCEACGGHRPIKVKKASSRSDLEAVREGAVIEVMIIDIGQKGDGVAKEGGYTIFVPGVTKGAKVKVKIEKTQGRIAFSRKVLEA